MRDPRRINEIAFALAECWSKFPDQRFGQLIYNMHTTYGSCDMYHVEDDLWLTWIKKFQDDKSVMTIKNLTVGNVFIKLKNKEISMIPINTIPKNNEKNTADITRKEYEEIKMKYNVLFEKGYIDLIY